MYLVENGNPELAQIVGKFGVLWLEAIVQIAPINRVKNEI